MTIPDRTAKSKSEAIQRCVNKGSIFSKFMESIGCLGVNIQLFYCKPFCVEFVDPLAEVHTNTIEVTWSAVKLQINPRFLTNLLCHASDQIYLEKRYRNELWESCLQTLLKPT